MLENEKQNISNQCVTFIPSIVTVKVQSSNNPPLSSHVQVTVFTPRGKKDPDISSHIDVVMIPSSVSTQGGWSQITELPALLARDVTVTGAGQVITGAALKPLKIDILIIASFQTT